MVTMSVISYVFLSSCSPLVSKKKCHCPESHIVGEMLLSPNENIRKKAQDAIACFTYMPDTMIWTYKKSFSGTEWEVTYKVKEYPFDPFQHYITIFSDSLDAYINRLIVLQKSFVFI